MKRVQKGLVNPVLSTIRQAQPPATRVAIKHPYQSYPQSIAGMAGRGYARNSQQLRQLQEDATAMSIGARPHPDYNNRRFYGLFGRDAVNEPQKAMSMIDRQQRNINQSLRTGNGNRRIQKASYGNSFVGDVKGVVVQPKKGRPFKGQTDSLTLVSKRKKPTAMKKAWNPFKSASEYTSPYADIYAEQATGKKPRNKNTERNQFEQYINAAYADPAKYRESVATGLAPFGVGAIGNITPKIAQAAKNVAPRVAAAATRISPKIGGRIAQALEQAGVKGATNAANNQLLSQMIDNSSKYNTLLDEILSGATNSARTAASAGARAGARAGASARNLYQQSVKYLSELPKRAGRAYWNFTTSPIREGLQAIKESYQQPWIRSYGPYNVPFTNRLLMNERNFLNLGKIGQGLGGIVGTAFGLPTALDTNVRIGQGIYDYVAAQQRQSKEGQRGINPEYATNVPKGYQTPILVNDARYDASAGMPAYMSPEMTMDAMQRIDAVRNKLTNKRYLTNAEIQQMYPQFSVTNDPYTLMDELVNAKSVNPNTYDFRYPNATPSNMFFENITFDDLTPEQQAEYVLRGKPIEYPITPNIARTASSQFPMAVTDIAQLANQAFREKVAPRLPFYARLPIGAALGYLENPMAVDMTTAIAPAALERFANIPSYQTNPIAQNPLLHETQRFMGKEPTYRPPNQFSALGTFGDVADEMFSVQSPETVLKDNPMSYVVGFAKKPSREGYYTNPSFPSIQDLTAQETKAVEYAKKQLAKDGIPATNEEITAFIRDLQSLSGFQNPLRVATISRVGDRNAANMVPYPIRQANARVYGKESVSPMDSLFSGNLQPTNPQLHSISDDDWFVGSEVPQNEYYASFRNQPMPTNWAEAVGVTPQGNQGQLNPWQQLEFGKRATPKKKTSSLQSKSVASKYQAKTPKRAAQPTPIVKKYQFTPPPPAPSVIMKRATTPTQSKYNVSNRPKNKYL